MHVRAAGRCWEPNSNAVARKATTRKPEAWYAISAKNIRASSEDTFDGYTLLRSQLQDDSDTPGASKRPEFIIWEMDSCNNN